MADPCGKEDVIDTILLEQAEMRGDLSDTQKQNNVIINNQERHADEFRDSINRLTNVLMDNVRHSESISQLKKETSILFGKEIILAGRIDTIEKTKSEYDGAEVYPKVKKLWNWYQQEQGWRRFIPAMMTFLACLAAILSFLHNNGVTI